ncbi:TldD/PmbA family protein [Bacillota bacterium LX-D]|nr:TldD/PmbA family protein [Bacillota bacterium LX-D]
MNILERKAQQAVEIAQSLGANMSEAYLETAKELNVEVSYQQVEAMKFADSQGLGMRVIINDKVGFAYNSDLSEEAMVATVKQAIANAEKNHIDEFNVLPKPSSSYPKLSLLDSSIHETSIEEKIYLAKSIEKEAMAFDPRVKIIENCTYQDAVYSIALANSNGITNSYEGAYCGAYAYLVAEENGDSQTGFSLDYSLSFKKLDPAKIGRKAAFRAVNMLGAKEIRTQKSTVVLDPYVATNFLGIIAPSLSAEAVQKDKSIFAGKKGKKVSSDVITIVDDGTMEGAILSAPFDGEGIATSETVLIKDGILQNYLYNSYAACKEGVESTGNGIRSSFKSTPEIGTTNFFIKPGQKTKEQLIEEIPKGLYVTEVMGMHTANLISGDFSVGAAGILIENGKLTTPVRGVAIAGNVFTLLENIDSIANDLTFFVGSGSPTIRIANMTISGI